MAKVDTQNIPSALLDGYRAALGEERPDTGVRKRYPYRVPTMQTKVGHPSPKQKAERTRFLTAKGDFAGVDWPGRQRWYDAAPPTSSFLWYYNFFIMSSLVGNADTHAGGFGVIKSIQYVTAILPAGASQDVNVAIAEVDPTKTVVMLFGAGARAVGEDAYVPIYPYPKALTATQLKIRASTTIEFGVGVGAIVIEYI